MKRLSQTDQGNTKIINVLDPTSAQDAATKAYVDSLFLPGEIKAYAPRTAPTGWLFCDGATPLRASYPSLFNALVPSLGAFTVTIASPALVTLAGHGFVTGDAVYLTTTGALPTGLSQNTLYYVRYVSTSTFRLSSTRANAAANIVIVTTGSQSGVHTLFACPYGLGNGSTTFTLPDLRGRVPIGNDGMGATTNNPAGRVNMTRSGGVYGQLGDAGGEEAHQLTLTELAQHAHTCTTFTVAAGNGNTLAASSGSIVSASAVGVNNAGGDTSHNNIPPALMVNYIIKT